MEPGKFGALLRFEGKEENRFRNSHPKI